MEFFRGKFIYYATATVAVLMAVLFILKALQNDFELFYLWDIIFDFIIAAALLFFAWAFYRRAKALPDTQDVD